MNYFLIDFWPNEAEHESYLSLMPEPGIPLDVAIRDVIYSI